MQINPAQALQSLQGMAVSFLQSLPYLAVALLIYAVFHLVARGMRRLITRLVARRHDNISAWSSAAWCRRASSPWVS
mgnify:CR=1 FL=1